jgi:undecaprenyl-diphosphatase
MNEYLSALILGIVEGLTEFLPVSSTGHMIIASSLMGIETDAFIKLFTVCIQLGCILSVFVLYFKRFFQSIDFYFKLFVAFVPAVIAGLLFKDVIDQLLESPLTVAIGLVVGGIILLFVDDWFNKPKYIDSNEMNYKQSFITGCFQVLAMVPGVSRSAATIVGGMQQGFTRKAAAEFSFFLAMPTMLGATVKTLYDYYKDVGALSSSQINQLLLGNVVAFVVGIFAMKLFVEFLAKKGFKIFGWYRIVVGGIIIALIATGHSLEII